MAPHTVTEQFHTAIPAPKLFQTVACEGHNLLPKMVPDVFASIQAMEGGGGPGTIYLTKFADGTSAKTRLDALDKAGLVHRYTFVEGETLKAKNLESVTVEVKLEATPDGKCKGTETVTFCPKAGTEFKVEDLKDEKLKSRAIFQKVEAYLQAHP